MLFGSNRAGDGARQLRIVSELAREQTDFETTEELVDFSSGKDTHIVTSKDSRYVTHIDAQSGITYRYSPYLCNVSRFKNEDLLKEDASIWNIVVKVRDSETNTDHLMQLYGLVAVWLNFEVGQKVYSYHEMIYSASKDVHRMAHKWSMLDQKESKMVHMYFMGDAQVPGSMSLEMIKITSADGAKLLQIISILSIEYDIDSQMYGDLLSPPLGFGCVDEDLSRRIAANFPTINSLFYNVLNRHSHKLEVEITASKVGASKATTLNVELVRSNFKISGSARNLQLVRQRNSKQDIKRIWDYNDRVSYTIDQRRGSCVIGNLEEKLTNSNIEGFTLKFNPEDAYGLKFDLHKDKLRELLVDSNGYFFVKMQKPVRKRDKSTLFFYSEKTSSTLIEGRLARIVRTYAYPPSDGHMLRSVTVWLMSIGQTGDRLEIEEIYHLNILTASPFNSDIELAKEFDISDECYV